MKSMMTFHQVARTHPLPVHLTTDSWVVLGISLRLFANRFHDHLIKLKFGGLIAHLECE